jgi:hypothetical protein
MPMPLRLHGDLEERVRFVEETAPGELVDRTVAELRAGEEPRDLLRAATLAVSRSSALPTDHHGGPVHPVAGIPAILGLTGRLDADWALMPVIHSVALANKHVNHPEMGPYIMAALPKGDMGELAADKASFRKAIENLEPSLAEHLLIRLLPRCGPGEILDLMLGRASRWNALDDHYFLYPVLAMRAVETLGWDSAEVLLRPPVRFIASNPSALGMEIPGEMASDYVATNVASYHRFAADVEELFSRHGLNDIVLPIETGPHEDDAVLALARRIGDVPAFAEIPRLVAEALGKGVSLDGAAEAMRVGGATIHMRTDYGNPFDVHFTTGMNARRWLLRLPGIGQENKILALLSLAYSPEIRLAEDKLAWPARPAPEMIAALPDLEQGDLLDAIETEIVSHPRRAVYESTPRVGLMRAGEPTRRIMALAWQYVEKGYDEEILFRRMGRIMCRDDFAEMHTFKHLQATTEEYANARPAHRDVYLVSAVKVAASTYGIAQDVFERARPHLAV